MPRKPSSQPTPKQKELLEFIISHVEKCGFQPSQQEMADHFGVLTNAIFERLKGLEGHGKIKLPRSTQTGRKTRDRGIELLTVRFTRQAKTRRKRKECH